MKNALLLIVTVAAVLCVVWFFQPDGVIPTDAFDGTTADAPAGGSTKLTGARNDTDRSTDADERRSPVVPQPSKPESKPTVFRGRCVDESGNPLTGVEVELRGWSHDFREGLPAAFEEPIQKTKMDGAFEFRIQHVEQHRFFLTLEHAKLIGSKGEWERVEPGIVKDFGDCVLFRGCTVSGRVRDTNGVPRKAVHVRLHHEDEYRRDNPGLRPTNPYACLTREDGSFVIESSTAPGKWDCEVWGERARLVAPVSIVVLAKDRTRFLDLTIKSDADIPSIRGIVVDDFGKPVTDAIIRTAEAGIARHEQQSQLFIGNKRRTKEDGTFILDRDDEQSDKPRLLTAEKEGYESVRLESCPWGKTDVRLVLRTGVVVTLVVTDAETGRPIEDFGIAFSGDKDHVGHDPERHENGRMKTRPLPRGVYECSVEPKDKRWLTGHRSVTLGKGPATEIHVVLPRATTRTLRVETADGKPVVGTAVELMEPLDAKLIGLDMQHRYEARIWCEGPTDAKGELQLRGPGKTPLTARIMGPGHPATLLRGIVLGSGKETIVAKVAMGATIHGAIRPLALLQQMKQMGKSDHENERPGLRLERGPETRVENLPIDVFQSFDLKDDGSFEVKGIPTGSWRLSLHWTKTDRKHGSGSGHSISLGLLRGLGEGERRKLEFDLKQYMFGMLTGKVLLNGEPYEGQVKLVSETAGTDHARSDKNGAFETPLLPGSYRVVILDWAKDWSHRQTEIPHDVLLHVAPGQKIRKTIRIVAGRLRLRVLGSDGQPRAGASIFARRGGGSESEFVAESDKAGLAKTLLLAEGNYAIRVWPKRLATDPAQDKFFEEHGDDDQAFESALIDVATIAVKFGSDDVIEIKLPY